MLQCLHTILKVKIPRDFRGLQQPIWHQGAGQIGKSPGKKGVPPLIPGEGDPIGGGELPSLTLPAPIGLERC